MNAASQLPFKVSMSIGYTSMDLNEKPTIPELMKRADRDLYAQKGRHPSQA